MSYKQENKRHDIEISSGDAPGFSVATTLGISRTIELAPHVIAVVGTQNGFAFSGGDVTTFTIPTTGWYRLISGGKVNVEAGEGIVLGVGICAGTPSFANLIAFKRRFHATHGSKQHMAISVTTEYYFTAGDTASLVGFSVVGPSYSSASENFNVSCRLIV